MLQAVVECPFHFVAPLQAACISISIWSSKIFTAFILSNYLHFRLVPREEEPRRKSRPRSRWKNCTSERWQRNWPGMMSWRGNTPPKETTMPWPIMQCMDSRISSAKDSLRSVEMALWNLSMMKLNGPSWPRSMPRRTRQRKPSIMSSVESTPGMMVFTSQAPCIMLQIQRGPGQATSLNRMTQRRRRCLQHLTQN